MKPITKPITFITGNQNKAEYLAAFLGYPVEHVKLDLDEPQSLSLEEIVERKVRQAYSIVQKPVLVEDASLEFCALGRLPGTFIKFFLQEMSEEVLCGLLQGKDRSAISSTVYGYFDGTTLQLFRSSHPGKIAVSPRGDHGYGWDRIYEPDGYNGATRAELSPSDHEKNYLQIKPLEAVRDYLQKQNNE